MLFIPLNRPRNDSKRQVVCLPFLVMSVFPFLVRHGLWLANTTYHAYLDWPSERVEGNALVFFRSIGDGLREGCHMV